MLTVLLDVGGATVTEDGWAVRINYLNTQMLNPASGLVGVRISITILAILFNETSNFRPFDVPKFSN